MRQNIWRGDSQAFSKMMKDTNPHIWDSVKSKENLKKKEKEENYTL